jgi:predicted phage terminase large subunit-like protein
VDLAVSLKTTADYTVVGVFGVTPDGKALVLEIDRARREGPDIVPAIARAVGRWKLPAVWIEKVGFQLMLIQEARREGIPVRELEADKDKVSRALPATAAFEGGRLFLPKTGPWLADFEAELLGFPNATHDDQVDVLGYAMAVLPGARSREPYTFGGPSRPTPAEEFRRMVLPDENPWDEFRGHRPFDW